MNNRSDSEGALVSPHRAGGVLALLEPGGRKNKALQAVGAVIGVALLIWAVSLVFSTENAEARTRLMQASPRLVFFLAAATFAGVLVVGCTFWLTLLPVRRIRLLNVLTVNAIAMVLTVLPFKVGFAMRIVLHHRIDVLSFKLIFSWVSAVTALGAASLMPLAGVSLWRGEVDMWWWVAFGASVLATHVGGWRFSCWTKRGALKGRASRLILHADDITSRPSAVIMHGISRTTEMALLAIRFSIASAIILGTPIDVGPAIILAATFVFLSVVAPVGALGVREWGVALVGEAVGLDLEPIMTITLLVTFSELVIAGLIALAGSMSVRPWKKRGILDANAASTVDQSQVKQDCSAHSSAE